MSDPSRDTWLDAQLRGTPLPEEFLEQLRAIAREGEATTHWSDAALDRALLNVAVPADLAATVQGAVAEERFDETLRDVVVPPVVVARARVIPDVRCRVPVWVRVAAAVLLVFAVEASYLTGIVAMTVAGRSTIPPERSIVTVDLGPLELKGNSAEDSAFSIVIDEGVVLAEPRRQEDEIALAQFDATPSLGPAGELALAFESGFRPLQNVILARWKPLGAQWADDALPSLETAPAVAAHGVEPPLVRGFDRVFLHKYGVFPVVDPRAHPVLAVSSVPLSTSSASFDLTERLVAENRIPDPRDVRLEDFLAALDYDFPLPQANEIAIRTAAGPSVFGNTYRGLRPQLLQIAAQAGPDGARATPATRLTVALDISASMDWNGRIEMAQRALAGLLEHFGPRDRLDLVAFNEEVVCLVDEASRDDRPKLRETLRGIRPHGGTNLDAGLREAVGLSFSGQGERTAARRIVLLTDGRMGLPPAESERIESFVREAAGQGVRLDVIDLSQQDEFPDYLQRMASAGEGQVRRGDNAEQIRWGLVESLLGHSAVVASQAALQVKFNPEAVAGYRLLGHEPGLVRLPSDETSLGELRTLQSATVLYEVWLAPGPTDDVATAELSWLDPSTGQSRRQVQRVSRLQFSPSLAEAPLSLQAATVAAQTAEVLRHSVFTPAGNRDYGNILNVASEVNSRLTQQASFRRLVNLIRRLDERQTRQDL